MISRIPGYATLLAAIPATSALAHPGHVADSGHGHTHWLAIAALAGAVAIGGVTWMRRRSGRRIARDRKL